MTGEMVMILLIGAAIGLFFGWLIGDSHGWQKGFDHANDIHGKKDMK